MSIAIDCNEIETVFEENFFPAYRFEDNDEEFNEDLFWDTIIAANTLFIENTKDGTIPVEFLRLIAYFSMFASDNLQMTPKIEAAKFVVGEFVNFASRGKLYKEGIVNEFVTDDVFDNMSPTEYYANPEFLFSFENPTLDDALNALANRTENRNPIYYNLEYSLQW